MFKNIMFLACAGLSLIACGGNNAVVNSANANAANAANSSQAKLAATAAPKPANDAAAKPAETGPKRVSFAKGKFETTENITLAPGASVQFVIGAKNEQRFDLTLSGKELTAKILKGKASELYDMKDEKDKYYQSVTEADGDIVFEIKNPTAKEIKSSVNIRLDLNGD